jgi:hypothetical protein
MHGHGTYHVSRYKSTPPYGFIVWCSHTATTSPPSPHYSCTLLYASLRIKQHSVRKTPPPNPCRARWIQSTTSHPTPSHLVFIRTLSYTVCSCMWFGAPNNRPNPRFWVKFTNSLVFWYDKRLLTPVRPSNWSTTHSRLFVTVYSLDMQLAAIVDCLHTQSSQFFLTSLNNDRVVKFEMQSHKFVGVCTTWASYDCLSLLLPWASREHFMARTDLNEVSRVMWRRHTMFSDLQHLFEGRSYLISCFIVHHATNMYGGVDI